METKPDKNESWNMRAIVIVVFACTWLVGGSAWYTCSIKQVCGDPLQVIVTENPPAPEPEPAEEAAVAQAEAEVPVITKQTTEEPKKEEPVVEETPVVEEPEVGNAKVVEEAKPIIPLVISSYRFGEWKAEAALSSTFYEQVTEVINKAKSHPGAIRIVGHADPIGPQEANEYTAQARATHMRDILIRHGIDAARIETTNAGSQKPIADNNSVDGRARNRRVEVFFE